MMCFPNNIGEFQIVEVMWRHYGDAPRYSRIKLLWLEAVTPENVYTSRRDEICEEIWVLQLYKLFTSRVMISTK